MQVVYRTYFLFLKYTFDICLHISLFSAKLSSVTLSERNTMITIKHPIDFPETYPLDRIGPKEQLLFFDIETTGFSGDTSQLYLIGCVYHDGFGWKLIQWFADTRQAESELLDAFFAFMKRFKTLIHFNGDHFDIPYLEKCCRRLGLSHSFEGMESMDIYKKIRPYRKLLGLESMKQKAIEQFLGISREDKYTGGQLIEVYRDYLHTHEKSLYDLLILHNEDDLKGMPAILPILSYADFFSSPISPQAPELWEGYCTEPTDTPLLHLTGTGSVSVPVPLEYSSGPVSLELYENKAVCTIRLCRGCLKYFYPDYKDYYYLPFEDTAVHKSVGEYVDRSARKKATARTCYTKKEGLFLPQFGSFKEPSFREDYKSPLTYVLYDDSLFSQPQAADTYFGQLFCWLLEQ